MFISINDMPNWGNSTKNKNENIPSELKSRAKLSCDGIIDLKRTGISPISPIIISTPKLKLHINSK